MRVRFGERHEVDECLFENYVLLKVGDVTVENTGRLINIPPSLGIAVELQEQIIDGAFSGVLELLSLESAWFCNRAILTPTMNKQQGSTRR